MRLIQLPATGIAVFFTTLTSLLSTTASHATDYSNLTPYEIEVIIFQNLGKNDAGSEIWPDLIEASTPVNPVYLQTTDATGQPGPETRGYYYTLIPDGKKRLMDEDKRLRASDQYRILKHIAWIQPGLSEENAESIYISTNNVSGNKLEQLVPELSQSTQSDESLVLNNANHQQPELNGTIKVVLGRFLHIYFDLTFRRDLTPVGGVMHADEGQTNFQDIRQYPVQVYRRMRSKELHYIDHPVIGILVLATPYEPPESTLNKNVTTTPVLMQLDQVPQQQ